MPLEPLRRQSSDPGSEGLWSPRLRSRSEALQREEEKLLRALIEREGEEYAPVIKAVIENEMQDSFEKTLSRHVHKKNAEIREICSTHYDDFIASTESLLTLKQKLASLRSDAAAANFRVQQAGDYTVELAERLEKYTVTSNNMKVTLSVLRACKATLALLKQAVAQIEDDDCAAALKTLDLVQKRYLDQYAHLEFFQHFESQIATFLFCIREDVKARFDKWVQNVAAHAEDIGARYMVAALHWIKAKEDHTQEKALSRSSVSVFSAEPLDQLQPQEVFDAAAISFSDLAGGYFIYDQLHIAERYSKMYTAARKHNLTSIFNEKYPSIDRFLNNFESYFSRLAGFFITEDAVSHSEKGFFTSSELEELWEGAESRIKVLLIDQFASLQRPEDFLKIKEALIVFANTVAALGYTVAPLFSFVLSQRDRYEELITFRLREEMKLILEQETYQCMQINDGAEFEKTTVGFDLHRCLEAYRDRYEAHVNVDAMIQLDWNAVEFPVSVPFSKLVPHLCRSIKRFIVDYFVFARNLPTLCKTIFEAVDGMLTHEVCKTLNRVLGASPGISQTAQTSINANILAMSCSFFENTIVHNARLIGQPSDDLATMRLKAATSFKRAKERAEDLIFEVINRKVLEFMQGLGGNFNWTPISTHRNPSSYIVDVTSYLKSITMSCLVYVPSHIVHGLHFVCCKSINATILQELYSARKYNLLGIHDLDLDIRTLEAYAQECGIPNLVDSFAEIRQLANLLLVGPLDDFVHQSVRQEKYPYLRVDRVLMVLDKFKDYGIMSVPPDSLQKIKRRDVDRIIKALR